MIAKTRSAAKQLGVTTPTLRSAIMNGKMEPPTKDELGHYLWTDDDIERARQALAQDRRRREYRESLKHE